MRVRIGLFVALALGIAGCASTQGNADGGALEDSPSASSGAFSDTWVGRTATAVADLVADPISANWEVKETRVAEDRFRLELRMKRLHQGGAGEAYPVFERHAWRLTQQAGYTRFSVDAYQEGLNSNWIAQRVASGEFVMKH